ncbi:MAG: AAA family ATPase [Herpetosiphonaceae bacterium]|nr:AAA family ATPase [Herpetosiphonaceae bacterium]
MMSHPFGDLLSRYLHRKHGLTQSKLAEGILQDPSIITKMCKGQRLTGIQARERVVGIIGWLRAQAAIETGTEANALLAAAGMASLRRDEPHEHALLQQLQPQPLPTLSPALLPSSATTKRTNLPAALTSFIGRTHELADVAQCIAMQRLVTLTGAGGVGKTRLATETGIRLVRGLDASAFADGVWLVELAELSQPPLVAQALVRLFKLPEQLGQTPLELLQEYLADKHLLLILDNCEHLVDTCADVVERLLRHCWRLHVLATSREELRIPGETIYPVLPLTLPDPLEHNPEQLLAAPAAQLFVERIGAGHRTQQAYREDAATIAHICRQLDGIPLALELAAPLTHSMSLIEIVDQLHNQMAILTNTYRTVIPRHQTMHHALVWSYRLLAPAEQQLLARVAVFAGGWMLEAVYAVCDGTPTADLLLALQQLVAKSLVLEEDLDGKRRYRLLEPVRQFARAQLAASGEQDSLRRRHASYYLQLAELAAPYLRSGARATWEDRLATEHENLRVALAWSEAQPDGAEMMVRLATALGLFWSARGHAGEGLGWLERGLARAGSATPASDTAVADTALSAPLRMAALAQGGSLAYFRGDFPRARAHCEQSIALYREHDDQRGLAYALSYLGWAEDDEANDRAPGRAALAESVALFRQVGDRWGLAETLRVLGMYTRCRGAYAESAAYYTECLALYRAEGDEDGIACALLELGTNALHTSEGLRAVGLLEESTRLFPKGQGLGLGWALIHLAEARRVVAATADTQNQAGSNDLAITALWEAGLIVLREIEASASLAQALLETGQMAYEQGDDQRAASLLAESISLMHTLGWQHTLAAALDARAALVDHGSLPARTGIKLAAALDARAALVASGAETEDAVRAAQLWGAAARLQLSDMLRLSPVRRARAGHAQDTVRAQLGAAHFATAWAEGQALSLDQAVLLALAPRTAQPAAPGTAPSTPPQAAPLPTALAHPAGLPDREVEILRLLAQDLTYAQIAERLIISPHTVNAHLRTIYSKLGVTSRGAATRFAVEHHLV